jgi:hypothetical protein
MTPFRKYLNSNSWLERANLINFYHTFKELKYPGWTHKKTADYFRISVGAVSEGLLISRNKSLIEDCSTRHEALEILRKKR